MSADGGTTDMSVANELDIETLCKAKQKGYKVFSTTNPGDPTQSMWRFTLPDGRMSVYFVQLTDLIVFIADNLEGYWTFSVMEK